jgi:hypothetical protein
MIAPQKTGEAPVVVALGIGREVVHRPVEHLPRLEKGVSLPLRHAFVQQRLRPGVRRIGPERPQAVGQQMRRALVRGGADVGEDRLQLGFLVRRVRADRLRRGKAGA